jgi:hypothetical protein
MRFSLSTWETTILLRASLSCHQALEQTLVDSAIGPSSNAAERAIPALPCAVMAMVQRLDFSLI